MQNTLFDSYTVKGNLKFFKNLDESEKITVSIGVSANHQRSHDIYKKLSDFLETLLIEDYITEDQHTSNLEMKKQEIKQAKVREKAIKDQQKKKKMAIAKNIKKQPKLETFY